MAETAVPSVYIPATGLAVVPRAFRDGPHAGIWKESTFLQRMRLFGNCWETNGNQGGKGNISK